MKNRRGSSLWTETDGLSNMIYRFEPGDIVTAVAAQQPQFIGVVKEVLPKINKIMVLWNGGSLKQHDPDEIMLSPYQDSIVRTRMASTRRGKVGFFPVMADQPPHGDQFVGDPEMHGIDTPRGGGFSIMQDLQKDLHKEQKKESEAGPKIAEEGRRVRGFFAVRGKVAADFSLIATGEMEMYDIQPGGEDYEWAQDIEKAAKEIQRFTKGKIRFVEMRPFDKYQGPYARMNIGKLWGGERQGEYFFEYSHGPDKGMAGTTDELAEGVLRAMMSKNGSLKSRRAMYWGAPERIYRLTKEEQANGSAVCPRCKKQMGLEPFTKSEKLYTCEKCGFKVPTSKTTNTRITIDVDKDTGDVDVDVTTAKGRRGK